MAVRANNTTDRLLADSFKELAQIKPVEKITIKDIKTTVMDITGYLVL